MIAVTAGLICSSLQPCFLFWSMLVSLLLQLQSECVASQRFFKIHVYACKIICLQSKAMLTLSCMNMAKLEVPTIPGSWSASKNLFVPLSR